MMIITGSSIEIGDVALAERSQVTTHICCRLGWPDECSWVMATVTTAFIPDVDVVISYGRVKSHLLSHWLCPITQLKQTGYRKKSHHSCGSTFSHNQPALTGYVVHDGSNWLSQHEFVEKELTKLLVLQLMLKYMDILNPKHYACQLVLLSTL
jgi:hypothetical protein